jgi:hypothetical protein
MGTKKKIVKQPAPIGPQFARVVLEAYEEGFQLGAKLEREAVLEDLRIIITNHTYQRLIERTENRYKS